MARDQYSSNHLQSPALPLHLCLFLAVLLMFVGISWYVNYESAFEDMLDQFKLLLMLCPLLLLLVVHWLSSHGSFLSFPIPLPEKDSLHRAGGTPWGVGLVLVFLFFMISYQSSLQERWFPLLSR